MNEETIKKLIELKQNLILIRPLVVDNSEQANNKRKLAWLLFDNAEFILNVLTK